MIAVTAAAMQGSVVPARDTYGLLPRGTSPWMYAVFAAFAAVFVIGVVRRLRPLGVPTLLRQAEGGVAAGLRRLVTLVLLQSRVARRARGWSHAAIFIAFLILTLGTALVALDWDALRPLGLRVLRGPFYLGYEAVLDAAGVAFLAGTLAALVRRLLRGGRDPRRAHREYVALLAALLYLGGTGFLLEGLRLALRPVPWGGWSFVGAWIAGLVHPLATSGAAGTVYVALWWSHAIVAFGLIAALPYSVFLHALTVPLNVVATSGRPKPALEAPFDLRELMASGEFDVQAGVSRVSDLEAHLRLALLACTNCGRCDEACSAVQMGTALSPRRLVQSLRRDLLADEPADDLLAGPLSEAELWACTTCAACVEACPVLVRPADLIVPFRRELVARNRLDGRQSEMLGNLGRGLNPYGLSAAERASVTRALQLPSPAQAPDADYLYWIGCAGAYDARIRSVVAAAVEVFRAGGLTVSALGEEEACTGDAARRLGEEGLFQQLALQNIETLQRYGVKRIVTHCAHCFNTLKNEYPRFGGTFDVVHHSQLIAELARSGRLPPAASAAGRVTFHDACYVGRYNRVFDSPREVLGAVAGLQLVEMERSRERSLCCGAGGANYWYDAPKREKAGAIRVREAQATGARTVVCECPFCIKMLEDAAAGAPGAEVQVRDVAEVVASALSDRHAADRGGQDAGAVAIHAGEGP
ncbi:MAG TPA: (Fe-S)-binding protein [Longimicrobiales bacterium]|nr:(Fe-S)-binding protein [Longimicrobiales bacterium]